MIMRAAAKQRVGERVIRSGYKSSIHSYET